MTGQSDPSHSAALHGARARELLLDRDAVSAAHPDSHHADSDPGPAQIT